MKINAILLGPVGTGKSALINNIVGKEVTVSKVSTNSVTYGINGPFDINYNSNIIGVWDSEGFGNSNQNYDNNTWSGIKAFIAKHNPIIVLCFNINSRYDTTSDNLIHRLHGEFNFSYVKNSLITAMTHTDMFRLNNPNENENDFLEINWKKLLSEKTRLFDSNSRFILTASPNPENPEIGIKKLGRESLLQEMINVHNKRPITTILPENKVEPKVHSHRKPQQDTYLVFLALLPLAATPANATSFEKTVNDLIKIDNVVDTLNGPGPGEIIGTQEFQKFVLALDKVPLKTYKKMRIVKQWCAAFEFDAERNISYTALNYRRRIDLIGSACITTLSLLKLSGGGKHNFEKFFRFLIKALQIKDDIVDEQEDYTNGFFHLPASESERSKIKELGNFYWERALTVKAKLKSEYRKVADILIEAIIEEYAISPEMSEVDPLNRTL